MSEKETIISLISKADITAKKFPASWLDDVLPQITDPYAKGYIEAEISRLNDIFSFQDEEFRDEILAICRCDIWKHQPPTV